MSSLRTIAIASICALLGGVAVAVATQTNYLGTVFIADTTTPTNQLAVNSDGSINAKVSGTVSPGGSAGGDLGATYPNPNVTNGSHITNASIPNSGLATPAPCSAFGTASGTCLQGGAGNVPNNSLVTPPTAVGTAAVGQIPGTATNDNAASGYVGELVVSGVAAVNKIGKSATVTISIASPAVITWASNPYYNAGATGNGCGGLVSFFTTGALPTGLTANTVPYYVTCNAALTSGAFNVSSSVANAIAGTAINTSGTQSGTQTGTTVLALGTGTALDFGGMLLTPGDWDVTEVAVFETASSTSVTSEVAGIVGTTGNVTESSPFYSYFSYSFAAEVPGTIVNALPTSLGRISLSAPTTVFCDIESTFTIAGTSGGGFCRARRVR